MNEPTLKPGVGLSWLENKLWDFWVRLESDISDRVKVYTGFFTIVFLDTWLTWWAVEEGLGKEINPLMVTATETGSWFYVFGAKVVVMMFVISAIYATDIKSKGSRMVINYIFIMGIFLVIWNSVNIGLSLVL